MIEEKLVSGTQRDLVRTSKVDPDTGTLYIDVELSGDLRPGQHLYMALSDSDSHCYHVGQLAGVATMVEATETLVFFVFAENRWPEETEHLTYGKNPTSIRENRKILKASLKALSKGIYSDHCDLMNRLDDFNKQRGHLVHGLVVWTPDGYRLANPNVKPIVKGLPSYVEFKSLFEIGNKVCDDLMSFAKKVLILRRTLALSQEFHDTVFVPDLIDSEPKLVRLEVFAERQVLSDAREAGIDLG